MQKDKAISNEEIIAAILSNGTFEKAAQACGISSRTIRERLNDPEFRADYAAARNEILRRAVTNLDNQLLSAIDTVAEIMTDPDNNAAIRLQAAQTIINNAGKLSDKLTKCENDARRINLPMDGALAELFTKISA